MDKSTGEGVSLVEVKMGTWAEQVPRIAGVEEAEEGEDPLRLDGAEVAPVLRLTRLRMPACSSPLDETVRLRCGRCCCECDNEGC